MQLHFRQISVQQIIHTKQSDSVPVEATHVGWYKGKIAFFIQLKPAEEALVKEYCGQRWRFCLIPQGAREVSFPCFCRENSGYHYGLPIFLDKNDRQL